MLQDRLEALPDQRNAAGRKRRIWRNDMQRLHLRLREEHPVEWVFVMRRQLAAAEQRLRQWQLHEPPSPHLAHPPLPQRIRQRQLSSAVLQDNLPQAGMIPFLE